MRAIYMKKVARFLCTKIREMAGGKKIRELAHRGDSVVLHSSRRKVLRLLSILYVHLRVYISTMERLCRRPFRPMADYALARASAAAKLTAELHAQARQNGRVLDDFVFRIGGSETLKVEADLDKFIPRPEFKGWKVFFETWLHDILLRTNMTTSVWQDMPAMVAFRDASVLDKDGAGIPASEFLRMLANLEDEPDTASFRWGLTISDSLRMMLQLQSLPESSTYLCGKPALRK
jgi:hypothetical protein